MLRDLSEYFAIFVGLQEGSLASLCVSSTEAIDVETPSRNTFEPGLTDSLANETKTSGSILLAILCFRGIVIGQKARCTWYISS